MAITDINISETLEAGAPSIKYTGNREPNMQMASAPDPMYERNSMAMNLFGKPLELLNQDELEDLEEAIANSLADGGRAHFGLGSIIKKIGKTAKKLVKSPIGKAGILGLAGFGLGGGFGPGGFSWGNLGSSLGLGTMKWAGPGGGQAFVPGGFLRGVSKFIPSSTMGKVALAGGLGLTAASAFEGMSDDEVTDLKNNPEALRAHLTQYHSNTHPEKSAKEVATWVETQMYSTGGRVGYADGTIKDMTISNNPNDPRNMTTVEIISIIKEGRSTPEMFEELRLRGVKGVDELEISGFGKTKKGDVAYSFDERLVDEYNPKTGTSNESFLMKMRESNPDVYGKYTRPKDYPKIGYYAPDDPTLMYKAKGGRIGFAFGPDQTAEAAGIMGQLPVKENKAGVKELDLRDSGGFIPPVGVKEKADDIPAMLSNNEFVMTADAVRAAGGGSVEKGAQVMYDQMKNLENRIA